MKGIKSLSGAGLFAVLILALSTPLQAQRSVSVLLAGYKQVPPVPSGGTGFLKVTLRGDTLAVKGNFDGLTSTFAGAYIHYGASGKRGNQLFRLQPQLNEEKTGGTFKAQKNQWVLNKSQLQALSEGHLYISIYSLEHRTGELRGQIPPLD